MSMQHAYCKYIRVSLHMSTEMNWCINLWCSRIPMPKKHVAIYRLYNSFWGGTSVLCDTEGGKIVDR